MRYDLTDKEMGGGSGNGSGGGDGSGGGGGDGNGGGSVSGIPEPGSPRCGDSRVDWSARELDPHKPSADTCFASLLHGDKLEYFLYACVLGRRLRDDSPGPDRVLLCGPGLCCDVKHRAALREAGWTAILPYFQWNPS